MVVLQGCREIITTSTSQLFSVSVLDCFFHNPLCGYVSRCFGYDYRSEQASPFNCVDAMNFPCIYFCSDDSSGDTVVVLF